MACSSLVSGGYQISSLPQTWSVAAMALNPAIGGAYLAAYLLFRAAMTWTIGVHGLDQRGVWGKMALIPLWDGLAFLIWVTSFVRRSVRWRGSDYYIRDGELVPLE